MTIKLEPMVEMIRRVHSGPVIDNYQWDTVIIPKTVKKYLKQYRLEKTCDPTNPVNTDDDLADRFFQAGLDIAEETGMLCTDTHRLVKYSRNELLDGLKMAVPKYTLGEGKDRCVVQTRKPEDHAEPHFSGPLSIQVTEDVFELIQEGIAQNPALDVIEGPSLESIYGQQIRGGSPLEQLASMHQKELTTKVLERVGRKGLGRHCSANSPTHYGVLGSYGLPEGYKPGRDIVLGMNPAEIKISYDSIYRMVQVYNAGHDGRWLSGTYSYIGGSAGGPEGAVACNIANSLLTISALQPSTTTNGIFDVRYLGNTDSKAQWALSVLDQALSRNINNVKGVTINSRAGPCTKMLLYENAVGMMNIVVSGTSAVTGVRSAGGRFVNYVTPLEHDFASKVYKASAKLSRLEANNIAKVLIPKYEHLLKDPPIGLSFKDAYDLKTNTPKPKWQKMCDEVENEIRDLGIPID